MKTTIESLLRHSFTGLAGLGALFATKGWIDPGDAGPVNAAGVSLADALVVILAAVIGRLLIAMTGKLLRSGAGEGRGSGGASALMLCMGLGVLMGSLASCTPPEREALRAIPLKACYIGKNGERICYSTKDGVEMEVDQRSGK